MSEVKKTSAEKKAPVKAAKKSAVKPAAKKSTPKTSKPAAKIAKQPAKSKAAKNAPAKASSMVSTTYFEVDGDQIRIDDVYTKVIDAYKAAGHRIGSVKTLDLYYNFTERRCYYVVNGKADGSFVEF